MRALLVFLGLGLLCAACGGGSSASNPAASPAAHCGAAKHHAYVEVVDNGRVLVTDCVGFDGASIDGVSLMKASHIEWATATDPKYGLEVCQVNSLPAHYSTCLDPHFYWAGWQWSNGAWTTAQVGISEMKFTDHQGLGWVWTSASSASPPPPPAPPTTT